METNSPNIDYSPYRIRTFTHWEIYVHASQAYLGRVYIWSRRPALVDLFDTQPEEWSELHQIANALKKVLSELFQPDLYNWCALGNLTSQCHVHLIPRYRSTRQFAGQTFTDDRWGQNYVPYNRDFAVSQEMLIALRDEINHRLPVTL